MMRNPVFESSMKRRMRSFRAPMLITLYILFLLLVCGTALMTLQKDLVSLRNLRSGLEAYLYLAIMQFMLIILVAPALTVGAISGERERQTLDLLLCTRVSALRIAWGKLLSSACFLALMIVCAMPVMAITLFFGGVSIWDMLLMTAFLLVTALACCAIGIFCSAVFKRTVTATVVTYLALFALGIGTIIFPLIFRMTDLSVIVDMINGATVDGVVYTGAELTAKVLAGLPKMFYINPGLGLLSMLINQTGLLQETMTDTIGWRGGQVYTLMINAKSLTLINIGVLLAASALLTFAAAAFIKPGGRKARKRK